MIVHGDCRRILREVPSNSFGACPVDPPYEIKILGEKWDATGVGFDPDVWNEVNRILKPGGYVAAFSSTRTYHRLACALEDCGFIVRDTITWLKGGANMPKGGRPGPQIDKAVGAKRKVVGQRTLSGTAALSTAERGGTHSVGVDSRGKKKVVDVTVAGSPEAEQWAAYGYNLKPASELICLAQKPFKGSAARNLLKWGVGALDVDGCGAPGNGRTVQQWPPNVIVTHDPRCTPKKCVPTCPSYIIGQQSGHCPSAGNKNATSSRGAIHGSTGRKAWSVEQVSLGDDGTAARYFPTFYYSVKASKFQKTMGGRVECPVKTVKPWALIAWLMRLITPPGEWAIDPFLGSGTGGVAALALPRRFYGIEKKRAHYICAKQRIKIARQWIAEGVQLCAA